jgi:hypothetical protein
MNEAQAVRHDSCSNTSSIVLQHAALSALVHEIVARAAGRIFTDCPLQKVPHIGAYT